MAKCPQCGNEVPFWERDIFTGACRQCLKIGARPATLGCGTLFIIFLIVFLGTDNIRKNAAQTREEVRQLQTAVTRLETAVTQQTVELRALREALQRGAEAPRSR